MVEILANPLKITLATTRTLSAPNVVTQNIPCYSRTALTPGFFTPRPISRKGKERALEGELRQPDCWLYRLSRCSEWSHLSRYPSHLSEFYPAQRHAILLREFMTKWDPPPIRRPNPSISYASKLYRVPESLHCLQRRHSSSSHRATEKSAPLISQDRINRPVSGPVSSHTSQDISSNDAYDEIPPASPSSIISTPTPDIVTGLSNEREFVRFDDLGSDMPTKGKMSSVTSNDPEILDPEQYSEDPTSPAFDGEFEDDAEDNETSSHLSKSRYQFRPVKRLALESVLPAARFDPNGACNAIEDAVKTDTLRMAKTDTLLAISSRLLNFAEMSDLHSEWRQSTAQQILNALKEVKWHRSLSTRQSMQSHTLLARALALTGDLPQAVEALHEAYNLLRVYKTLRWVLNAYEQVFVCISQYHGSEQLLDFVVAEWPRIGSYLLNPIYVQKFELSALPGHKMRRRLHSILSGLQAPETLLEQRRSWPADDWVVTATLLINAFCLKDLAKDALKVLSVMRDFGRPPDTDTQLIVVRCLVRQDWFRPASAMFHELAISSRTAFYLSTGLYLYAHQGDINRAKLFYDELREQNWANPVDQAMFLYSYAKTGRVNELESEFDKLFPKSGDGRRENGPQTIHYNVMLYGFVQRGDVERTMLWRDEMDLADLERDKYTYQIELKGHALQGDVDSIATAFSEMRNAGISPGVVGYTTAIGLLSNRRDPQAAEALFIRAVQDGVKPDRQMISAIMDAHVEAGSWKGVIRVFDFLQSSEERHLNLTIVEYNTILKAYLFIGAPFALVAKVFNKLEAAKIQPDKYTYALLIQAACDAGKMDLASGIFSEMEALEAAIPGDNLINVHVLTIIMSGFLHKRDLNRAMAVFEKMLQRGIQPLSSTYANVLRAYSNQRTEESYRIAEDFLKTLLAQSPEKRSWDYPTHGRKTPLDIIYGPLMKAYASDGKAEDLQRLVSDYLDSRGEPTIGVLTTILNSYRRSFNVDAAVELWPQIVKLGLSMSKTVYLFPDHAIETATATRSDVLSIPLSIYLDTVSSAGYHEKTSEAWQSFQNHGLSFTSHNWNHLCVALVRAGQTLKAFEILEVVLLPYQRKSEAALNDERDRHPSSPLTFALESEEYDFEGNAVPDEAPRRQFTRRSSRSALANRSLRKTSSPVLINEDSEEIDFAHPLHLLHQLSPSWNIWRPHFATMRLLLMVLERLERGQLIQPVKPVGVNEDADSGDESDEYSVDVDADELSDPEQRREEAWRTVDLLYEQCPDTMVVLERFRGWQKSRLGTDYRRIYNQP